MLEAKSNPDLLSIVNLLRGTIIFLSFKMKINPCPFVDGRPITFYLQLDYQ